MKLNENFGQNRAMKNKSQNDVDFHGAAINLLEYNNIIRKLPVRDSVGIF